jgi:hypothetical protein
MPIDLNMAGQSIPFTSPTAPTHQRGGSTLMNDDGSVDISGVAAMFEPK